LEKKCANESRTREETNLRGVALMISCNDADHCKSSLLLAVVVGAALATIKIG